MPPSSKLEMKYKEVNDTIWIDYTAPYKDKYYTKLIYRKI